MSLRHSLTGCAAALGVVALVVVGTAMPATAHITANPRAAEKGSYAKISFRVPNERPKAGTTKVEVFLPAEHVIASVSIRKVPGWTASLEKRKLDQPITSGEQPVTEVVSKITWTGGKIAPGEFEEFDVSMGRLPENADQLLFKAIQTYENGEVVRWIEDPAPEGQPQPKNPAPMIKLLAKGALTPGVAPAQAMGSHESDESDGVARWLGGGGVALAVAGLALGAWGLRRRTS